MFGVAHLFVSRNLLDAVFFGGFVIFAFFSAIHQDKKKSVLSGGGLDEFIQFTSIFLFAAIVSGRQSLSLAELSKIGLILGVPGAIYAHGLHGVS